MLDLDNYLDLPLLIELRKGYIKAIVDLDRDRVMLIKDDGEPLYSKYRVAELMQSYLDHVAGLDRLIKAHADKPVVVIGDELC